MKQKKCSELGKHKDILHEVLLLQKLNHPNVIRCYGWFYKPSHQGTRQLFIILEYAGRGDLCKIIKARRQKNKYEYYFLNIMLTIVVLLCNQKSFTFLNQSYKV